MLDLRQMSFLILCMAAVSAKHHLSRPPRRGPALPAGRPGAGRFSVCRARFFHQEKARAIRKFWAGIIAGDDSDADAHPPPFLR